MKYHSNKCFKGFLPPCQKGGKASEHKLIRLQHIFIFALLSAMEMMFSTVSQIAWYSCLNPAAFRIISVTKSLFSPSWPLQTGSMLYSPLTHQHLTPLDLIYADQPQPPPCLLPLDLQWSLIDTRDHLAREPMQEPLWAPSFGFQLQCSVPPFHHPRHLLKHSR